MTSTVSHIRSMRELAYRSDDGIDVTMYWYPETDELKVCVCDGRNGAYFEFEPDAANALDAFYHPYSYASRSSVHYEDRRLAA